MVSLQKWHFLDPRFPCHSLILFFLTSLPSAIVQNATNTSSERYTNVILLIINVIINRWLKK